VMMFYRKILILTWFLLFITNSSPSQKIYHAPGEESRQQEITEDPNEKIFSVYLLGDIKYPQKSKNLELIKKEIYMLEEKKNKKIA
ncbi:MAG: hypothetical protein K8R53_14240, partial [Bacteroidales bacterium]|nr:hypothetical protein [Bacteroidales bacterium]